MKKELQVCRWVRVGKGKAMKERISSNPLKIAELNMVVSYGKTDLSRLRQNLNTNIT